MGYFAEFGRQFGVESVAASPETCPSPGCVIMPNLVTLDQVALTHVWRILGKFGPMQRPVLSWSLKIMESGTDQLDIYDFLSVVNSKHSHREVSDIYGDRFRSKKTLIFQTHCSYRPSSESGFYNAR